MTELAMPSANSWFGIRLLPNVLSLTAESMDVIGFLGLGGLFTAHITGNLVREPLMKATVVSAPLGSWLLKKPDWLDHQTAVGLGF
jgi:hypothetical protein